MMKKLLSLLLAGVMVMGGAATVHADEGYELALITDVGTIDDKSFNQGSWEGLEAYAKDKNLTCKYYKPAEKSDAACMTSIDLAVKGGAKVIVTPGFLFEYPVLEAQEDYTNDPLFASLSAFVKEKGYKNGYVMWPLRTAVSGKQMTPAGATEIMEIIGKEETLKRVKAAIEKLS